MTIQEFYKKNLTEFEEKYPAVFIEKAIIESVNNLQIIGKYKENHDHLSFIRSDLSKVEFYVDYMDGSNGYREFVGSLVEERPIFNTIDYTNSDTFYKTFINEISDYVLIHSINIKEKLDINEQVKFFEILKSDLIFQEFDDMEVFYQDESIGYYNNVNGFDSEQFKNQFNTKIFISDKLSNEKLKDFIYKIDETDHLKIECDDESIDEFFNMSNDESFSTGCTGSPKLCILSNNSLNRYNNLNGYTKIITITKDIDENDNNIFKFLVDIETVKDSFSMKSTFVTKEEFEKLLNSTINALRSYDTLSVYADDLEKVLE